MKLELNFSDLDAPKLTRTQFQAEPGGSPSETLCPEEANYEKTPELGLKWTAGIRAISVLLLRWKAGEDARLAGSDGAARQAWDFVRKCKDANHPLARVFGGEKNVNAIFIHSGSADSVVAVELHSSAAAKLKLVVRASVNSRYRELADAECGKLADRIEAELDHSPATRDAEAEDAPLAVHVELRANREHLANFLPVEAGLLPLREGDRVRLHARFNFAVQGVAIWIDSTGAVAPLHPWETGEKNAFTWKCPPSLPAASLELALPLDPRLGFEINTPRGIETGIVLASRSPLDAAAVARIKAALREVPAPNVRPADLEAGPLTYFRHRDTARDAAHPQFRIGPASMPPSHPFAPFQRALAARFDGLGLDCLCILSVPSLGTSASAKPRAANRP